MVNAGVSHEFKWSPDAKPMTVRFDIVNLFDKIYELRNGSGIGVFAPQYGARRGFFAGISQKLYSCAVARASRRSPHLARGFDHECELFDLVLDRHRLPADAGGKSALRGKRELFERRVAARLFDAALEFVLAFHLRALGGDEAEHRDLAFRQKAQRRE